MNSKELNDVHHTFLSMTCGAISNHRRKANEGKITPKNMIGLVIAEEDKWGAINRMI